MGCDNALRPRIVQEGEGTGEAERSPAEEEDQQRAGTATEREEAHQGHGDGGAATVQFDVGSDSGHIRQERTWEGTRALNEDPAWEIESRQTVNGWPRKEKEGTQTWERARLHARQEDQGGTNSRTEDDPAKEAGRKNTSLKGYSN